MKRTELNDPFDIEVIFTGYTPLSKKEENEINVLYVTPRMSNWQPITSYRVVCFVNGDSTITRTRGLVPKK